MISFCESVSLSREKFSDFDTIAPTQDIKKVYLAGYLINEEGEKENVQIPAGYFLNSNPDDTVSDLKPDTETPLMTILDRVYRDQKIKLIRFNYVPGISFFQFNHIDEELYSKVNNNKYFCIRMPVDAPLGQEYKIYFANVPAEHGLLLFPSMNVPIKDDKPIEVFMNKDGVSNNDYLVHVINLLDPKKDDGSKKTKLLSIHNMETDNEDDLVYLTFTSGI